MTTMTDNPTARAESLRREICANRILRGDYEGLGIVEIDGRELHIGGRCFGGQYNAKGWIALWYQVGSTVMFRAFQEWDGTESLGWTDRDYPTDADIERYEERMEGEIKDLIDATIEEEIADAAKAVRARAAKIDAGDWFGPSGSPLPSPYRAPEFSFSKALKPFAEAVTQ